jgi:ComF family protein
MLMQEKFQTLIQLLFPPRCVNCGALVATDFGLCGACWHGMSFIGGLVCDKCGVSLPGEAETGTEVCDDCLEIERPWNKGRSALLYRDNARKLVLALKHGDRHDVAYPAARWMALAAKPLVKKDALLVPIPLHRRRFFLRKFNQAALLTQALAKELSLQSCLDLLERPVVGGTMKDLSMDERFARMQGAITVNPKHENFVADAKILLVDDVMTTGATLTAAADALIAHGAKDVNVITLARVAKDA